MQEANYQLSDCTSLHSLIRAHSYGPSGGLVGRPKVEISEHWDINITVPDCKYDAGSFN